MKIKVLKRFYHVYENSTSINQLIVKDLDYEHLLISMYRANSIHHIKTDDIIMKIIFEKFENEGLYDIL